MDAIAKLNLDYLLNSKYFVVDFENTGGSLWKGHKITGIGVCVVEPYQGKFKVIQKFSTLVNPEREISQFIENLIGIKTVEVNSDKYPTIDKVFSKLEKMSFNRIFTAHAVKADYNMFDYLYFQKYSKHYKVNGLDTLKLAKRILGIKKANIKHVSELFEINTGQHHEPDFDAYVAAVILMKSLKLLRKDPSLFEEFKLCFSEFKDLYQEKK